MPPTPKKYDLDLSKMGDEELVVLAKECGYRPAADELLVRYQDWTKRLIAFRARPTRLSEADVQDAQQNAVFGLLEAISGYNTMEMVRPGGCSFRSYARVVLTSRFRDFLKRQSRVERHYDRSSTAQQRLEEPIPAGRMTDPSEAVQWDEALRRLHQTLEEVDPGDRQLWQALAVGTELRKIALDLGVSYDSVKRRRRRLLANLAARFRELRD